MYLPVPVYQALSLQARKTMPDFSHGFRSPCLNEQRHFIVFISLSINVPCERFKGNHFEEGIWKSRDLETFFLLQELKWVERAQSEGKLSQLLNKPTVSQHCVLPAWTSTEPPRNVTQRLPH